MPASGSITLWLDRLRNQEDSIAQNALWQQFATRVLSLARAKLRYHRTKIADEDDVANSVFEALFTGVASGGFPNLNNRDDLWGLLIRLTENKAIDLIRYENRKRRIAKPNGAGPLDKREENDVQNDLSNFPDKRLTAEEELQFAETCSLLLARLEDPVLIAIAQFKLEGHSNTAISEFISRPLRTVERKIAMIRSIWSNIHEE
ncbi:MAG: hypothetical protein JNK90_19060 [Planctomycetaceae bacterium]|nr:hypothetical protein [Planctomycetaceae bacterium]